MYKATSWSKLMLVSALLLACALLAVSPAHAAKKPTEVNQYRYVWEVVDTPTTATMYDLDMYDPANGWSGGSAGFMSRYSGGQWNPFPTAFDSPINAVDMTAADRGWGVTWKGEAIYFDGVSWTVHSKPATASLSDIYMLGTGDGFAVGGVSSGGTGTILRYQGGSWVPVTSPTSVWLKAVDMLNSSDGWIVGASGVRLRWDGAFWSGVASQAGIVLTDVDMVNSNDVWAVGTSGALLHWDGINWTQVLPSPTTADLNAVAMVSSTEGWAVGSSGTILYYNEGTWQEYPSPTTRTLNDIELVGPAEAWAVGARGEFLHLTAAPADLSTSHQAVAPKQVAEGETLTYTISIRNTGGTAAPSVVMTDTLPTDTTYVLDSASTTSGTLQGPDPLVATIGTLPAGEAVTVTFQVTADVTGKACWFARNDAQIRSGDTDLTRTTWVVVGVCETTYLPLVLKSY